MMAIKKYLEILQQELHPIGYLIGQDRTKVNLIMFRCAETILLGG